jgi:carboxyl-terminal processing protease
MLTRHKFRAPIALIALLPLGVFAQEQCPTPNVASITEEQVIEFQPSQNQTMLAMLDLLDQAHYADVDIDDLFSQAWLDEYLETLDPGKSFLLASDIREFEENYATRLDDLAKQGVLEPAKVIYERFRERALDQIESNLAILRDETLAFDFESNRSLPIDRDAYDWPENPQAADQRRMDNLTLAMLNLRLTGQEDQESRDSLIRRYESQLSNIKQQNTRQVVDFYLNAMAHLYDPHTDYFSPRESENFEINMSLSLEGIGAVLQREDEFTQVVEIVAGGPASLQGELQPNDRIVAIGEGPDCPFIDIVGWRLDEVVDMIRGPKGSQIRLRIIPAEADELSEERHVVAIIRDEVKLEDNAAKGEIQTYEANGEEYAIGVIDVPSFYLDIQAMRNRDRDYRSTTQDVLRILRDFSEQGVDGVIVDLRGNGGGSLLESATMVDLFVDPGPVVQVRDHDGNVYRNNRARNPAYYNGPLMVLVDRLSASASEIFAGAIQDYGRGLVVGTQTFGKGTVQSVAGLPEGQIKLTESKFYRITGESTQHRGVVPDIDLPTFFKLEDIGESAYDTALGWDEIRGIPHRRYNDFSPYIADLMAAHQERAQTDADLMYLAGTLALNEERSARENISLNEQTRIEERDYFEAREEDLLNQWKLAKGIPIEEAEKLASTDPLMDQEVLQASEESAANDDEDDPNEPDLAQSLLDESIRIFADLMSLRG